MESATPRSAPIFRTPGQGLSFNDISEVDAEMARVKAYLVELRGIRNSMTLAIRVPPEVLGQIFLNLKALERQKCISTSYYGTPCPKPLLAVTRVCRAWRIAALTYPALWTFVSIHYSPSIARWMISNSAGHGITFDGYFDADPDRRLRETTTSDVVLKHLPRITEMLLGFDRKYLDSDSDSESDEDDPYRGRSWQKRDRAKASYEGDRAIGLISSHHGPSVLRILSITNGYNLVFSATPMPCLRFLRYVSIGDLSPEGLPLSLVLQSISLNNCFVPSLVDFLHAIHTRYPNLMSLVMEDCTTKDSPHAAVALPQLTLLRITGNAKDVSRIASGIRISQGCKLHLILHTGTLQRPLNGLSHLIFERDDGDTFLARSAYFDIHSERLNIVLHTEAPPLRSLLALSLQHKPRSTDSDDLLGEPLYTAPVVINLSCRELNRTDVAWLACYRAVVPLENLETLAVQWNRTSLPAYRRGWQPTFVWGDLLAGMTRLRSLRTNQDIDGVLCALCATPPVSSTEHVLVPSLQRLVIDDVTAGHHILGKIERALGQRKANGATMDSVAISLWDDGEQRGHVEFAKMIEEHGEVVGVQLIYRVDSSADL